MPRVRVYQDTDVLTEAKKRIHHIFDIFDTVVVMFSGGKDSLAYPLTISATSILSAVKKRMCVNGRCHGLRARRL